MRSWAARSTYICTYLPSVPYLKFVAQVPAGKEPETLICGVFDVKILHFRFIHIPASFLRVRFDLQRQALQSIHRQFRKQHVSSHTPGSYSNLRLEATSIQL